jgi:hypothetical protein
MPLQKGEGDAEIGLWSGKWAIQKDFLLKCALTGGRSAQLGEPFPFTILVVCPGSLMGKIASISLELLY